MTLRELIAQEYARSRGLQPEMSNSLPASCYKFADQILSLISVEIDKKLLSDEAIDEEYAIWVKSHNNELQDIFNNIAERQLSAIKELFEEYK